MRSNIVVLAVYTFGWLFLIISCDQLILSDYRRIKRCKHGFFLLLKSDNYVSKSLDIFGEWAELELELFLQIVQPGDVVLDIGANIGAFSVPIANKITDSGQLHAFEPQHWAHSVLSTNLALNGHISPSIHTYWAGVGSASGTIRVPYLDVNMEQNFGALSLKGDIWKDTPQEQYFDVEMLSLDSLSFDRCPNFVKMDVEGMEAEVLKGARRLFSPNISSSDDDIHTNARGCRPVMYVENNAEKHSAELIRLLHNDFDYDLFWVLRSQYNINNYFENTDPVEADKFHYVEINMLCVPRERRKSVNIDDRNIFLVDPNRPYLSQYERYIIVEGEGAKLLVQS